MIKLENEKLIFEKDTCPFNPGDRISIVYEQKDDIIYPVIGLNDILSDSSSYKLTNSYNINLKGKNYKYLLHLIDDIKVSITSLNKYIKYTSDSTNTMKSRVEQYMEYVNKKRKAKDDFIELEKKIKEEECN